MGINTVVWTFEHNNNNTPDRRTFINGFIIHLLDDGSLYHPQSNTNSETQYQCIDDITKQQLCNFIKTIKVQSV